MALLVVEFFGLPGVGKSTLAVKLAERFRDEGYSVNDCLLQLDSCSKTERIFKKVPLVFSSITSPWNISLMLRSFWQFGWNDVQRLAFNWLFVSGALGQQTDSRSITVLDQGLFQAIWAFLIRSSACRSSCVYDIARRYLERSRVKLLVVTVSAPLSVIQDRISNRSGFSPLDQDISVLGHGVTAEKYVLGAINELARSCKDLHVAQINCMDAVDVDDVLNLVAAKVELIISSDT